MRPRDSQKELALAMSEGQLLRLVVEAAKRCGWLVHHDRPAQNRRGQWQTPVMGVVGFPDLVLVRPPRCFVVELKRERARTTEYQNLWLEAFANVQSVETRVWRPSDWLAHRILDELTGNWSGNGQRAAETGYN
jgi:hypothetical protein